MLNYKRFLGTHGFEPRTLGFSYSIIFSKRTITGKKKEKRFVFPDALPTELGSHNFASDWVRTNILRRRSALHVPLVLQKQRPTICWQIFYIYRCPKSDRILIKVGSSIPKHRPKTSIGNALSVSE